MIIKRYLKNLLKNQEFKRIKLWNLGGLGGKTEALKEIKNLKLIKFLKFVLIDHMKKERFKITPSVYLILTKDNKILLTKRYNTGYFDGNYSFPAGHLDGGETLKQAMVRETKEEIGVLLDSVDLELVHVMNRRIPNDERADFFFTAKEYQGEPKIMEPDKCNDLNWFKLDNLPKNIIPYIKQAIDSFLNNVIYSEREGRED